MKSVAVILLLIGTALAIDVSIESSFIPDCPFDEPLDFFPHESNCTLFYICSHGEVTLYECPDNLHFNPIDKVCDYQEHAGCEFYNSTSTTEEPTTTTTEEPTTPECRNSNIYLGSHETDCSKFYVHISGKSYLVNCNSGFEFDFDAQDCVKISKYGCMASKLRTRM